jgi:hypothetical protein
LIVDLDALHPLHHAEEIGSALRQLHYTRSREDHRCLRSQLKEEEDTDNGVCTMAGPDETFDENLSMNTQLPFATQMQRPVKRRTNDDDEIQFIGAKSLEPILAGNTRRAELKREIHTSAQEDQQKAKLLSLLKSVQPSRQPQTHSHDRAEIRSESRSVGHHAVNTTQPQRTPDRTASRHTADITNASTTPTQLDKGKKRMQEAVVDSPATESLAKKKSSSKKESKQHNGSEMEKFAAECSWMKGLKFNHDTSTVPQEQVNILSKPESWHKPLPGLRFPEANIPMQIFMTLSRLEDERVAALEVSSGSYGGTDPSPVSHPTTSAPQVEDEQEDEQEDELEDESDDEPATSLVSWTPSPEPPQRPTSPRRGLPPDSSIEVPQDTTETAVSHKPAVAVSHSPPPTLPASSNKDEVDAPPSSLPSVRNPNDSDEDMELETSVPQALGEDLEVRMVSSPVRPHVPQIAAHAASIVQVKETSYAKAKTGQPIVTISPPTQTSKSDSHQDQSSSASVVRGTYHDMSSSAVDETNLDVLREANSKAHQHNTRISLPDPVVQAQILSRDKINADTTMFDTFVNTESLQDSTWQVHERRAASNPQTGRAYESVPTQPEPTPVSAQPPPKDTSSSEQAAPATAEERSALPVQPEKGPSRQPSATPSLKKRKLEMSPSQASKRLRRERGPIKIFSFGGGNSEEMQKQRGESKRKSQLRQRSTTSAESRRSSVSGMVAQRDADTKMEDSDTNKVLQPRVEVVAEGNMSPRHRSLYDSPSPKLRPLAVPAAAVPVPESIAVSQDEVGAPKENLRQEVPEKLVRPKQTDAQLQMQSSPKPKPEIEAKSASMPVSEPQPSTHTKTPTPEVQARNEQPPSAPVEIAKPTTVFEAFKEAYSEYQGDIKHFRGQCMQVEKLEQEDKMVPKWMWDDFIIRNRTDYKDYVVKCLEQAETAMPYIRFYKDTIRDTIYKKGIVDSRATLLKALQELGVETPAVQAPVSTPQTVQQPDHRSSLSSVQRTPHIRQSQQQPRRISPPQHSRLSPQQPHQSPVPPPTQPLKKRSSRQSLPFAIPKNPIQDRLVRTPRDRHSLPAHPGSSSTSFRPAHQPPTTRPKSTTRVSDFLRQAHNDIVSSTPASSTTSTSTPGDNFRNFVKSHQRLTGWTGSTRVSSTPTPSSTQDQTRIPSSVSIPTPNPNPNTRLEKDGGSRSSRG